MTVLLARNKETERQKSKGENKRKNDRDGREGGRTLVLENERLIRYGCV